MHRQNFNIISAALAAALAVAFLTACGGKSAVNAGDTRQEAKEQGQAGNGSTGSRSTTVDTSGLLDKNNPVTVTVWHYYNGVQQNQFDDFVAEFNSTVGTEQGIIVEAKSKNSVNELASAVMASVNKEPGSETMPNIFGTYAETAYLVDRLGMLVDMSDYITDEEKSEYVDAYIEEGKLGQDGALKIFPVAKSTEIMAVNTTDWDIFAAETGAELTDLSTWEGLVATAKEYYEYTDALTPETPGDGKSFYGLDSTANYLIVGAMELGHPFALLEEDGSVTVEADRDTIKRLWENFYVPYVKGYCGSEGRFRSDDVKTGKIITLIGSTASASYYPTEVTVNDEYTYPIDNTVLSYPSFEGCERYVVQQGAGMSMLKSDARTEYAGTVFLKWFTEAERNINFAINSGYMPVKQEAADYSAIESCGKEAGIGDIMLKTLKVAIDEVVNDKLYTSPPYEASADVRSYIESYMNDTSQAAYAESMERIANGETAEDVWEEYTDDAAFDAWFSEFAEGFAKVSYNKEWNVQDE